MIGFDTLDNACGIRSSQEERKAFEKYWNRSDRLMIFTQFKAFVLGYRASQRAWNAWIQEGQRLESEWPKQSRFKTWLGKKRKGCKIHLGCDS